MKPGRGTLRPGTVRAVLDNGCIKASAPGLFSFTDDPEKMPPIMPWQIGSNSNNFSKPKVYDEVWILNFADNPRQLFWFRKDKLERNENIDINGEENVEIVCNRDVAGEWCTIYFSDGSGWVIGKGDSVIQIDKDGNIFLTNDMPHRTISINNSCIGLGSTGPTHSVCYAEETQNALMALCKLLSKVGMKALANPYTAPIGQTIMTNLSSVTNAIPGIASPHVKLD